MSFKDCVNTKDCGKMQTDIEDVKDVISGITDDVETINDTTIPAIEDEIAGLDDRVTTLENSPSGGNNYRFVGTSDDWDNYNDSNRILIFSRSDGKRVQLIIPKGQPFDFIKRHDVNFGTYYNGTEMRTLTGNIVAVFTNQSGVINTMADTLIVKESDKSITFSKGISVTYNKLGETSWSGNSNGVFMLTDKPVS